MGIKGSLLFFFLILLIILLVIGLDLLITECKAYLRLKKNKRSNIWPYVYLIFISLIIFWCIHVKKSKLILFVLYPMSFIFKETHWIWENIPVFLILIEDLMVRFLLFISSICSDEYVFFLIYSGVRLFLVIFEFCINAVLLNIVSILFENETLFIIFIQACWVIGIGIILIFFRLKNIVHMDIFYYTRLTFWELLLSFIVFRHANEYEFFIRIWFFTVIVFMNVFFYYKHFILNSVYYKSTQGLLFNLFKHFDHFYGYNEFSYNPIYFSTKQFLHIYLLTNIMFLLFNWYSLYMYIFLFYFTD